MWVDFIRRLLYEGIIPGVNIWFLIILFFFLGLIWTNWTYLKFSFGYVEWRRRFVAMNTNRIKVRVDLPPKGVEMSREDLQSLNSSVVAGIKRYAEKNDLPDPLDEIRSENVREGSGR